MGQRGGGDFSRSDVVLMCPHCGWRYDPSVNGEGYQLVPGHLFDFKVCPGQEQTPRNAESDRPLWKDEASRGGGDFSEWSKSHVD